jgi:hypothetical protein
MDSSTDTSAYGGTPGIVIGVIIGLLMIASMWKVFSKAGKPGWAAIIPIYNIYIGVKVAKRPGWWTLLYFIPVVNLVTHIVVSLDTAKAFGKGGGFGFFGLFLFPFIGYPILGFGDAKYKKA